MDTDAPQQAAGAAAADDAGDDDPEADAAAAGEEDDGVEPADLGAPEPASDERRYCRLMRWLRQRDDNDKVSAQAYRTINSFTAGGARRCAVATAAA
jgi:hypothetical protein